MEASDDEDSDDEDEPDLGLLVPPTLNSGNPVTGANKGKHRLENKRCRVAKHMQQGDTNYWLSHRGGFKSRH